MATKQSKSKLQSAEADVSDTSWDLIGKKLISEGLHLTALELFAELTERGKELPVLKQFFSSPSNIESRLEVDSGFLLERSSSLQTFDSLDFARNSEDGENKHIEDKIAVLEFELRKAKETINSLRTNLTVVTTNNEINLSDNDVTAAQQTRRDPVASPLHSFDGSASAIKPHEKRAVNFLVNAYLMRHNYKMSSITFCDENGDQDFDNWEDVGLNIPQPPDILMLYRHYWLSFCGPKHPFNLPTAESNNEDVLQVSSSDNGSQTELKTNEEKGTQTEFSEINEVVKEVKPRHDFDVSVHEIGTQELETSTSESSKEEKLPKDVSIVSFCEPSDQIEHTSFQSAMFAISSIVIPSFTYDSDVENSEELVDFLAKCLPQMTSNIIINKRCEVIPLIAWTCIIQKDYERQEELLNLLFNLIKRPTKEQREAIISAFVSVAKKVCPRSGFLSKLCEQIDHKYPERRMFVAEMCSVLSSFTSYDIRSSILLSCLTELIENEKDNEVLECAVMNLSIVCSFLAKDEEKEKIGFVTNFLVNLMEKRCFDNRRCLECVLNLLLPSISYWSLNVNCIQSELSVKILDKIDEVLNGQDKEVSLVMLEALNVLMTYIFICIVRQNPIFVSTNKVMNRVHYDSQDPRLLSTNLHHNLYLLLEQHAIEQFYMCIGKDWFKSWTEFDWTFDYFVPRIINFIPSLLLDVHLINETTSMFRKFCGFFNDLIIRTKIKPRFESWFKHPFSEDENCFKNSFSNGYLMVYFCAVLSSLKELKEEETRNEIMLLHDALTTISLLNLPLTAIELIVSFTAKHSVDGNNNLCIILTFLNETLKHSNSLVRKNIAKLFTIVLDCESNCLSKTIITQQIWPSIVSLSNDNDVEVRSASLQVFRSILMHIRSCNEEDDYKGITEKIYFELQTFLEDQANRDHHIIRLELIHLFERITNVLTEEHKYFDEMFINFSIPRLAAIAVECGSSAASKTKKQDIVVALIKTYNAFAKIPFDVISDYLVKDAILPALRYIKDETKKVAPDYEAFTHSLIAEFERRVNLMSSVVSSDTSQPPSTTVSPSSSTTFSPLTGNAMVDDMKNKVKGILNKASPVGSAAKTNFTNLFQIKRK